MCFPPLADQHTGAIHWAIENAGRERRFRASRFCGSRSSRRDSNRRDEHPQVLLPGVASGMTRQCDNGRVARIKGADADRLRLIEEATNPSTRPQRLITLLAEHEALVQRIAHNPACPAELLVVLARRPDPQTRVLAARHLRTPEDILEELALDDTAAVRVAATYNLAARQGDAPVAYIEKWSAKQRLSAVADPSTSAQTRVALLLSPPRLRRLIARSSATQREVLRLMVHDNDTKVRFLLTEHPAIPHDVLKALASDPNPYVRRAAARRMRPPSSRRAAGTKPSRNRTVALGAAAISFGSGGKRAAAWVADTREWKALSVPSNADIASLTVALYCAVALTRARRGVLFTTNRTVAAALLDDTSPLPLGLPRLDLLHQVRKLVNAKTLRVALVAADDDNPLIDLAERIALLHHRAKKWTLSEESVTQTADRYIADDLPLLEDTDWGRWLGGTEADSG